VTHPRFYLTANLNGPTAELLGPEAHHLHNVMRLQPGDEIELFDGDGTEATARVESASKKRVVVSILSRQPGAAELPAPLVLATAVPKGDRFRWLVEKATELGVTRLVPLQTERSVVDPRATKLEKMRAAVIAASKQCRRAQLMEITPLQNWSEFLTSLPASDPLFIAHPGGAAWRADWVAGDQPTVICIGPEGGFSDVEISLANARATLVDLGPRILRIETAALALVALCGASLRS